MGLLWQSSGYDSALPLHGVWVHPWSGNGDPAGSTSWEKKQNMANKIKHTGFNINKVGSSPSPFSFVSLSFPFFYFSSWMIMSYNCWLKHRCGHLHCVWGGEWVWLMCLNKTLVPNSWEEGGLWAVDQHGMSEQGRMIMMFRWEWKGGYQPSKKLDSKCSPSDERQSLSKVGKLYTCKRYPKMKCWPVWAKENVLALGHGSDIKFWNPSWVRRPLCDRRSHTQDVRAHLQWGGNLYWRKYSVTKYNSPLYTVVQTQYYSTVSI